MLSVVSTVQKQFVLPTQYISNLFVTYNQFVIKSFILLIIQLLFSRNKPKLNIRNKLRYESFVLVVALTVS